MLAVVLVGCGGGDDDSGEADAALVADAAPTTCDPATPSCGEHELCLQGEDDRFTCKVPMCEITGAGAGPCCDLRAADGSGARGVCVDGQCRNARDSQANERCADLLALATD